MPSRDLGYSVQWAGPRAGPGYRPLPPCPPTQGLDRVQQGELETPSLPRRSRVMSRGKTEGKVRLRITALCFKTHQEHIGLWCVVVIRDKVSQVFLEDDQVSQFMFVDTLSGWPTQSLTRPRVSLCGLIVFYIMSLPHYGVHIDKRPMQRQTKSDLWCLHRKNIENTVTKYCWHCFACTPRTSPRWCIVRVVREWVHNVFRLIFHQLAESVRIEEHKTFLYRHPSRLSYEVLLVACKIPRKGYTGS